MDVSKLSIKIEKSYVGTNYDQEITVSLFYDHQLISEDTVSVCVPQQTDE